MPIRVLLTEGTKADCSMALDLLQGLPMEYLLADRGYDTNAIVNFANERGAQVVIPPGKHRKEPRSYDKFLYQYRHPVENAFLKFKQFRGIATRYAKTLSAFWGCIHLAAIVQWVRCVA